MDYIFDQLLRKNTLHKYILNKDSINPVLIMILFHSLHSGLGRFEIMPRIIGLPNANPLFLSITDKNFFECLESLASVNPNNMPININHWKSTNNTSDVS